QEIMKKYCPSLFRILTYLLCSQRCYTCFVLVIDAGRENFLRPLVVIQVTQGTVENPLLLIAWLASWQRLPRSKDSKKRPHKRFSVIYSCAFAWKTANGHWDAENRCSA